MAFVADRLLSLHGWGAVLVVFLLPGLELLTVAALGSEVLSRAVKVLIHRARPPAPFAVGHFDGYAFPPDLRRRARRCGAR
jgi:hypothetical protein